MKKLFVFLALCFLSFGAWAQSANRLPYNILSQGSIRISPAYEKHYEGHFCIMIKDQDELAEFWQKYTTQVGPKPVMPDINFQNKMLVITSEGVEWADCPSGHYVLAGIVQQGNSIVVTFNYKDQGWSCESLNRAYDMRGYIFSIDKSDLSVEVSEDGKVVASGQSYAQWRSEFKRKMLAAMPRGQGFVSLVYGLFTGQQENFIVNNNVDYAKILQKAGDESDDEKVDFSQNIVLAVFDGIVKKVSNDDNRVRVGVYHMDRLSLPRWAANKQYYHIVKIPYTSLPIEFVDSSVISGGDFTSPKEVLEKIEKSGKQPQEALEEILGKQTQRTTTVTQDK